jgi:hypothetical protein
MASSRLSLANFRPSSTHRARYLIQPTGAKGFFVGKPSYVYVKTISIHTSDLDNDSRKTFRLLFTGASSAATGFCPKGIKKCKAAIHGIREPAAETIAYAAVLVSSLLVVFSASNHCSRLVLVSHLSSPGPTSTAHISLRDCGATSLGFLTLTKACLRAGSKKRQSGGESKFSRLSWSTSNSVFSQTPGLRTLLSVHDVDCESDDDETNDFTILRRQAAGGWARDGTHGEEGNVIQAISWPAPVRNDNGTANLSDWSAPQSPTVSQTRADISLIGLPSDRHAHFQPQASQVTWHRAQRPQIPPIVLSGFRIPRAVRPRPIAGDRTPRATQVLAQTPPTPSPRIQIPRVLQLSPRRSQRSQVTQPPRRPPPAPVSNWFAATQAIQASTQEPDAPLRPLQSIQLARSQVRPDDSQFFHTL